MAPRRRWLPAQIITNVRGVVRNLREFPGRSAHQGEALILERKPGFRSKVSTMFWGVLPFPANDQGPSACVHQVPLRRAQVATSVATDDGD